MPKSLRILCASLAVLCLSACAVVPEATQSCPAVPSATAANAWTGKVAALTCQRDLLGPITLANLKDHGAADQAVRAIYSQIGQLPTPSEDAIAARALIMADMASDAGRGAQLLALKPAGRWFSAEELDPQGHQAAFLIIQHSTPDIMRAVLPDLAKAAADGLVAREAVALMTDRVLVSDGQPQEYGTQGSCINGQLGLPPVREPETVDARRAAMGIDMPLAQYQELMRHHMRC